MTKYHIYLTLNNPGTYLTMEQCRYCDELTTGMIEQVLDNAIMWHDIESVTDLHTAYNWLIDHIDFNAIEKFSFSMFDDSEPEKETEFQPAFIDFVDYNAFKAAYKATIKKYPATDTMFSYLPLIRVETVNYWRPAAGTRWIETDRKTELVGSIFYMKVVDSVSFFRALGGTEKVKTAYTKAGILPVSVSSISPDKRNRTIRKFHFE